MKTILAILLFLSLSFTAYSYLYPSKAVKLLPQSKQDQVFVELSSDQF